MWKTPAGTKFPELLDKSVITWNELSFIFKTKQIKARMMMKSLAWSNLILIWEKVIPSKYLQ